MRRNYVNLLLLLGLILISATNAFAAGSGMPWEDPLSQIVDSIEGPIARFLGVGSIVVTGLGISFSEGGGGMRKMLWVVFGLSIAFAASSFFLSFFGFSSGAAF